MRHLKSQYLSLPTLILLFIGAVQPAFASNPDHIPAGSNCDMRYLLTGVSFFEVGSYRLALGQFKPIAGRGCDEAQYYLGLMHEKGFEVEKDYGQAETWYRKAADQGHAKAQYHLGQLHYFGRGIPKDAVQAVQWTRKAAQQGHADAEYFLGNCYAMGQGVPKDHAQAFQWTRKAAQQGHAEAQYRLGLFYHYGSGVAKDPYLAAAWYRKAIEQGHEDAKRKLQQIPAGATASRAGQQGEASAAALQQQQATAQRETIAYYVAERGQPVGPLTAVQIAQRIQSGQLKATDLVWREGLADWAKAQDVAELRARLQQRQGNTRAATPPPAPRPQPTPSWRDSVNTHAVEGTYRLDPVATEQAAFNRYLREYGESEREQARMDARADADFLLQITLSAGGDAVLQVGSGAHREIDRGRWELNGEQLKIRIGPPNPDLITGTLRQGVMYLQEQGVTNIVLRK